MSHFFPRQRTGTFFCIYIIQNTQHIISLITVDMAQPLLPILSTITKNKSPSMLSTELAIRKYSGVWLSPSALSVLEKKLYRNVNTSPINIMRIYDVVSFIIEESTCKICSIGVASRIHSTLNIKENTTPDSIVVLIWR